MRRVSFSLDDNYVISVGEKDGAVIQWKLIKPLDSYMQRAANEEFQSIEEEEEVTFKAIVLESDDDDSETERAMHQLMDAQNLEEEEAEDGGGKVKELADLLVDTRGEVAGNLKALKVAAKGGNVGKKKEAEKLGAVSQNAAAKGDRAAKGDDRELPLDEQKKRARDRYGADLEVRAIGTFTEDCKVLVDATEANAEMSNAPNTVDGEPIFVVERSPNETLKLEHVFGFRSTLKSGLHYTADGQALLTAASIAILQDPVTGDQRIFPGHTDSVICMTCHRKSAMAATAQMVEAAVASRARIKVWSTNSLVVRKTIEHNREGPLLFLEFDISGEHLFAMNSGGTFQLTIWEWQSGSQQYSVCLSPSGVKVHALCCHTLKQQCFMSVGVKHVIAWTLDVQKGEAGGAPGMFDGVTIRQTMLCACCTADGLFLTGGKTGDIFMWNHDLLEWRFDGAHAGAVSCLQSHGDYFISAGADTVIILWHGMDKTGVFDMRGGLCPSKCSAAFTICALSWMPLSENPRGNFALIGTSNSDIIELDLTEGTARLIGCAHSSLCKITGLAVHGKEEIFVTCAVDKTIRKWDMRGTKLLGQVNMHAEVLCVAFSSDSEFLVAGLSTGQFMIFSSSDLVERGGAWDKKLPISVAAFAPDNRHLALGFTNGEVDIYDCTDVPLKRRCISTPDADLGPVVRIDFARESATFRAQYRGGVCRILRTITGYAVENIVGIRNTEWATYTCITGWHIKGIFERRDIASITAVTRSTSKRLCVVADNLALLRLFRWPAPYATSQCKRYAGHNPFVTHVAFGGENDSRLISVGEDSTIFLWRIDI